jgi:hypothetical protein
MDELRCYGCGRELGEGALRYVVEIKGFADYDGCIGDCDVDEDELIRAIENIPVKTLEEDIHYERVYIVCKSCKDKLLSDPFHSGKSPEGLDAEKGSLH